MNFMDFGLLHGFAAAMSPVNLIYCFVGTLLGTVVGVLPGLGPAATISILLPVTAYVNPTAAVIMVAGVYYGAMYGGSTTSILMNIPGEAASVPTTFDGFQMTKQGRAGEALAISAIGSFIAGTAGVVMLSVLGPFLANFALSFGPPEYFCLMVFSLTTLFSFSGGAIRRGAITGVVGLILASVGLDPMTGKQRMVFGIPQLFGGLDVVSVIMGLFGISEVLFSANEKTVSLYDGSLGRLLPRGKELSKGLMASFRGTGLGLALGLLPGMLASVTSFLVYDVEKRFSKYPDKFGHGAIEGVAAPEAANNATAQAGFVPLMALGIPTMPVMAILLALLMIYGLNPGPLLFQQHADFAWAVIASMYIGNVMLLILNLPLVGLWARLCLIPYYILGPIILGVVFIGSYSIRNSIFDVWTSIIFGTLGYMMKIKNWPVAPLILGFILGPILEQNLRATLQMSSNIFSLLLDRPIALALLALTVVLVFISRKMWAAVPKES